MFRRTLPFLAALALVSSPASAATFIVPDDPRLIRQADAIVFGAALNSYAQLNDRDAIETVTNFSIEEVIKGDIRTEQISIVEPGGVYGDQFYIIPGSPQFKEGERHLLFLRRLEAGWTVHDLVIGKFSWRSDAIGRDILARDSENLNGWDQGGKVHVERMRLAGRFLDYIRVLVKGGPALDDYFIPGPEPLTRLKTNATGLLPINTAASPSPTTYLAGASSGTRWNIFPAPVNWFSVGTEPGAPGNGVTAINAAFNAWNGDASSNVNYLYAGDDPSGTHTGGIGTADSQNTIAFERDLSCCADFQCTASSYSGTLGVGGVRGDGTTHVGPNNETFFTATEGDVEMNRGIADCNLLFNSGNFNSAVTHEVGHTLGFRHSDQNRTNGACTADLECSSSAIMTSSVTNGINATLQTWDQNAVRAVYPGSGGGTAPAAPTGVTATAQSTTSVLVTWNAVTGATSYEIHRKGPGNTPYTLRSPTTATSLTDTGLTPNSSYRYFVRAVGLGGTSTDSAPDHATTVIFTDEPLTPGVIIKVVHLTELRTAVDAMRALAGLGPYPYVDAAVPGLVVKAIHVAQLRQAINEAWTALSLSVPAYTDPSLTGVVIKAIHWQQVRDRVK